MSLRTNPVVGHFAIGGVSAASTGPGVQLPTVYTVYTDDQLIYPRSNHATPKHNTNEPSQPR